MSETYTHDPIPTPHFDASTTPHGGRLAVTLEDVHAQNEQILAYLSEVAEFVGVIKGIGAQAAKGGGMQAMMLRNMVPGIENLAG